jgi:hypothetical protein
MDALRARMWLDLSECRMAKKNDEIDVLGRLYLSLLDNEPIPAWLAVAFIERYQRGQQGKIRSWDEAFGKPNRYGIGERFQRSKEQEARVVAEVERLRAEGRSLNEEEFAAIGRRLGVGGKTKVKELLHNNRFWAERVNALLELGRQISKNYRR